ncbi:unnamed protein product [Schistosoma curassoni]|uniref:Transposase n=1 Tax=Schistosoma curassoni TaxID=6186 RepID=A0A183KRR3_9TREM|nr:unnamed protein product [Schistosoma curassoni]
MDPGSSKHPSKQIVRSIIWEAAINHSEVTCKRPDHHDERQCKEANKKLKKRIIVYKQKYVQDLATTKKKSAREGTMKQSHDIMKKLAREYSKPGRLVKDKEGKMITEIQRQRDRWVEYFEEFLNRPAPFNLPDIEVASTDLPTDVTKPTI